MTSDSHEPPPLSVKRRIKRFAPMQLARVMGILYGIVGLVAVPLFGLMGLATSLASRSAGHPPPAPFPALGLGFGALALILPVLYAIMGFIAGLIGAVLYNVIAKWVGGIEVEVE